ncbi:type II toxin-antitoxin system PemK/MazF family toxin [Mesorhizobium sp. M8A.F.Ca.ET.021.01.1.1]|nr:type II toxin-antitoxin system PemK/MazF family toxin [Mesorhizobium sp. M8A.F.Ca.ET.021.01.1.1]
MISFTPQRGSILMCNFDMGCVPPEMPKTRRVVVVSPRSYNFRISGGETAEGEKIWLPGKCVVVPLSATEPRAIEPSHVPFTVGPYRSLTVDTWAICELVDHVSHARLDRVQRRGKFLQEQVSAADLARIEAGLRHALGL